MQNVSHTKHISRIEKGGGIICATRETKRLRRMLVKEGETSGEGQANSYS